MILPIPIIYLPVTKLPSLLATKVLLHNVPKYHPDTQASYESNSSYSILD